jgi:hypothetical protein
MRREHATVGLIRQRGDPPVEGTLSGEPPGKSDGTARKQLAARGLAAPAGSSPTRCRQGSPNSRDPE